MTRNKLSDEVAGHLLNKKQQQQKLIYGAPFSNALLQQAKQNRHPSRPAQSWWLHVTAALGGIQNPTRFVLQAKNRPAEAFWLMAYTSRRQRYKGAISNSKGQTNIVFHILSINGMNCIIIWRVCCRVAASNDRSCQEMPLSLGFTYSVLLWSFYPLFLFFYSVILCKHSCNNRTK